MGVRAFRWLAVAGEAGEAGRRCSSGNQVEWGLLFAGVSRHHEGQDQCVQIYSLWKEQFMKKRSSDPSRLSDGSPDGRVTTDGTDRHLDSDSTAAGDVTANDDSRDMHKAEDGAEPPLLSPLGSTPDSIGSYEIIEEIDRGGMGIVYKARQLNPRRIVALKTVQRDELSSRFAVEIESLARLKHPAVAQIYESGEVRADGGGGVPYFTMEWVEGEQVCVFAEERQLELRDRVELIVRLCHGVEHAHEQGIIHRDLKPDNIIVTESGQPKILDFGLARTVDLDRSKHLSGEKRFLGTIPYMSPEQASGRAVRLDERSDEYSLAVVAYEVLTRRSPYRVDRSNAPELLRAIQEDSPVPMLELPPAERDLQTILRKALSKEKERRYPTVAAFRLDLERYLAQEPIDARPPSSWYQLRLFSRRNKGLVAGVVAAVLALSTGLAGTAWGLFEANESAREAQEAEASRRVSEAEAMKGDAERAWQLGQWDRAQMLYERLLQDEFVELDNVNRSEIHYELARLAQQRDDPTGALGHLAKAEEAGPYPAELVAPALLLELDLNLTIGRDVSKTEQQIEALLPSLNEAPKLYAQGLLATSAEEALTVLNEALALDPYLHRAHELIAAISLFSGNLVGVERQVAIWRRVLPNAAKPHVFDAMAQAFRGDRDRARQACKKVEEAFGVKTTSALTTNVNLISQVMADLNREKPGLSFGTIAAVVALVVKSSSSGALTSVSSLLRKESSGQYSVAGINLASARCVRLGLSSFFSGLKHLLMYRNPKAAVRHFEKAAHALPSVYTQLLLGHSYLQISSKNFDERVRLAYSAANAYDSAANVPGALLRRMSQFSRSMAADWFGRISENHTDLKEAERFRQLGVRSLRTLLRENRKVYELPKLLDYAMSLKDRSSAIAILALWEDREPQSKLLQIERAETELKFGHYANALRSASSAQSLDLSDEEEKRVTEVQRLSQEALSKLASQFSAGKLAPTNVDSVQAEEGGK